MGGRKKKKERKETETTLIHKPTMKRKEDLVRNQGVGAKGHLEQDIPQPGQGMAMISTLNPIQNNHHKGGKYIDRDMTSLESSLPNP